MISKIKKKFLKMKDFLKDMFVNTLSFGLYIIAQQIVLMPTMSRLFAEQEYSRYILYISIFAVITNVLGSELGITRQVRAEKEKGSDYNRILFSLAPIVMAASIIALYLLKYRVIDIVFFVITILMANIRLYAGSYFRMNKTFKKVMFQNALYLIGIIIGLILTIWLPYVWLPTLIAEILALIYSLINTDVLKAGIKKSESNKEIIKTFINLGTVSLLTNGIVYFDKILVYPILGDTAVTVYYATSTMSKVISLIINPLYSVILSWLKADDKEFKNKIMLLTIKANIPMVIITFIVSLPLTFISLRILYPQYIETAKNIIIPICMALAFGTVSSIVKAIVLKYMESKKVVKVYILYFIIFIISAIIMSKYMGLIGFAYANVISKFSIWVMFLLLLWKCTKNIDEGENNK